MLRLVVVFLAIWTASEIQAGPFRFRRQSAAPAGQVQAVSYGDFSTCQGVANHMARILRIGHFGGNRGFEGVGCGATPEAAFNNTCRPRGGGAPSETGCARGANGLFYCCNRWN